MPRDHPAHALPAAPPRPRCDAAALTALTAAPARARSAGMDHHKALMQVAVNKSGLA